jgi:hypothetical protein
LRSPEIEYLACTRSNATAPSSITTAAVLSERKFSSVLERISGVIDQVFQIRGENLCDE